MTSVSEYNFYTHDVILLENEVYKIVHYRLDFSKN